MFNIPNGLSFSRIILSIYLLLLSPTQAPYYIIYTVCGITDMLDGYLARKLNAMTDFGAKLDSIADLIMVFVVLYTLLPLLHLSEFFWRWIIGIIMIRIFNMAFVMAKFKSFGVIHSYANKAIGFLLFLTPFAFAFSVVPLAAFILCSIGTIAAIEETCIHVSSKNLNLNRKSIFIK